MEKMILKISNENNKILISYQSKSFQKRFRAKHKDTNSSLKRLNHKDIK